ncbi:nucleotidyl transferase AbiEii/AbiGii toxin family protein [Deinococcus detaillensis]|uniref:nucleotidyl transferase AbiEii/AbiGii toxin family protein n=1 Tax=Deinococcus detaillensis TaxID=2592048 RepID=UPI001CDD65E9|nr:nucleotidyl transferase AbiEii/AbiGii toxin family protein [Deinococcus detaillensis]
MTLCELLFGDGLSFDAASIQVAPINAHLTYPGVTARLRVISGPSQVTLQLDVSFGNVITLAPVKLFFPPLLLDERVAVTVYPLETVITEKFAALVELGALTTRMKDIGDLPMILTTEPFQAAAVAEAPTRSLAARATLQEQVPIILGAEFAANPALTARWQHYLRRTGLTAPAYREVMMLLRAFYDPLLLEGQRAGQ